jgi:hypothetical protein
MVGPGVVDVDAGAAAQELGGEHGVLAKQVDEDLVVERGHGIT